MRKMMDHQRWLMMLCLAMTVALAGACGDNGGGGGGGGGGNVDAGPDVAVDGGAQDGGVSDGGLQDGGQDVSGQDGGGACDLNGFTPPTDMQLDETAFDWNLLGQSGDQVISLSLSKDGGATDVGTYTFTDTDLTNAANTLILGSGCTQQGCATLFQATSGTLDITTFEKTQDGAFAATLSNVTLEAVQVDQNNNITKVPNGQTWCLSDVSLTATTDPMDPFAATCDQTGFTAADGQTTATRDAAQNAPLIVEAASSASTPQDVLSLQIYPDFDGAATSPGTYQIDDYNFATCANCLLIYTGCDSSGQCQKTYSAGEGTLSVQQIGSAGDHFQATLTNAKLAEVTIDNTNYDTEIVQGGSGWCINSFSWDVDITAPSQ